MIKNIKNAVMWTYVISYLWGGKKCRNVLWKTIAKKKKKNQKKFTNDEVIKGKGGKINVKWKGYDNSFNSWIDNES